MNKNALVKSEEIQNKICTLRGVQVMLDKDLARLYGVETKAFNQAVKRNIERFPSEFMFQLTADEYSSLRSQIVTLNNKRGKHRKYLPFAFTEQGVAMLSAVLRSETAVKASIQIINAFVAMRIFIAANTRVFHRLDEVERKQIEYKVESDRKFDQILMPLKNEA